MFLLDGIGLNMHRRDYNPVRKEMIETLRQFQAPLRELRALQRGGSGGAIAFAADRLGRWIC